MNINVSSSINTVSAQRYDNTGVRPEGFEGSSKDMFVRDQDKEYEAQKAFREAGEMFAQKHRGGNHGPNGGGKVSGPKGPGEVELDGVNMYENRNGYDENFLGKDYPLPTVTSEAHGKVAHLLKHPDESVLTYTNYSVVMNSDRKQCYFSACNIDGNQSQNVKRSGSWQIDGRIARDAQLGNEAYGNNNIDKGHMTRRLDPAWGKDANMGSLDTFCYTNACLQHGNLNQKEWLELENHVLGSARGQKMSVLTGPVFSENDPKFTNGGRVNPPTQMPMQFWKVVTWNDNKSGELKTAAFVLSQKDIVAQDGGLFKGGFEPGRFSVYQVPIKDLEGMTNLQFGKATDITTDAVRLSSANNYTPQGLN